MQIGDLASDYFVQILKERGIGVRAAIGAGTLPGGAPVEIQIIAAAEKSKSLIICTANITGIARLHLRLICYKRGG